MTLDSSPVPAAAGLPRNSDDLDWLVGLLRETMTAVVAQEADILKKAGMIARLAALVLRASEAVVLKRTCEEVQSYCAEVEERLAVVEARAAETPPRPLPAASEAISPAAEPRQAPRASVVTPRGSIPAIAAGEAEAFPIVTIGAPATRTREDRPAENR
jgi:hypothetical protein